MNKTNILIIAVCIFLTTRPILSQTVLSQDSIDIIRFRGFSKTGDLILGVHLDKENAIRVAFNLMDTDTVINKKLTDVKFSIETMDKKKALQFYKLFEETFPKGYRVILKEEFEKLSPLEKGSFLVKESFIIKT